MQTIRVVAVASLAGILSIGAGATAAGASTTRSTPTGYDVSYPQCNHSLPSSGAFGIVGVNDGLPWSANPCLKTQWTWASRKSSPPSFYLNTADPGPISSHWNLPGPRACVAPTSYSDAGCAYDYGWNAAAQSLATAATATSSAIATGHAWWLDVETMNSWNGNPASNAADLQGAYDYLRSRGVQVVGVYSTGYQWGVITGGYAMPAAPQLGRGRLEPEGCSVLLSQFLHGRPGPARAIPVRKF